MKFAVVGLGIKADWYSASNKIQSSKDRDCWARGRGRAGDRPLRGFAWGWRGDWGIRGSGIKNSYGV